MTDDKTPGQVAAEAFDSDLWGETSWETTSDEVRAAWEKAARAVLETRPGGVVVTMTREDANELFMILTSDRYRMDKGDDRPVPQPRWGANVRVSKAVMAALDSVKEGGAAGYPECAACGHLIRRGGGLCGAITRVPALSDTERCSCVHADSSSGTVHGIRPHTGRLGDVSSSDDPPYLMASKEG